MSELIGFTPDDIREDKQADMEMLRILANRIENTPTDSFEKEFKRQGTIFNARVRAIQLQSEINNLEK